MDCKSGAGDFCDDFSVVHKENCRLSRQRRLIRKFQIIFQHVEHNTNDQHAIHFKSFQHPNNGFGQPSVQN